MELNDILRVAVEESASDVILKTGSRPTLRGKGGLKFISDEEITRDFATLVLAQLLDDRTMERYVRGDEIDSSYAVVGLGRFRVNIFKQMGEPGLVFRYIQSDVPNFTALNLPAVQLEKLSRLSRGLVLVTGITGCGKSTCLASMIEFMNRELNRHVVTIEDPIEYVFSDKTCVITQREIGRDSQSYVSALKYAVRQAPDVIMLGEMRDLETVESAIRAAETGHLVLSTLHTVNAIQTMERILAFFPPHQHDLVRLQLSLVLSGVISLRLIKSIDGTCRMPAAEILMDTPTVKEIIKEGRTTELDKALREGEYFGTVTFNQSLAQLYSEGKIGYHEALDAADNPDELKLVLSGVSRGIRLTDIK
ncbi:MAG: type IV pilus twitching motility protein PilT [Planctomycetota bacterium]|jgi:twitching motility protein PilT